MIAQRELLLVHSYDKKVFQSINTKFAINSETGAFPEKVGKTSKISKFFTDS